MKVTCMDISCKWNDGYRCKRKEIGLSWHQVMTVHDGRKEFLSCKGYEESDLSKDIRAFLERAQKEGMKPDDERGF